MKLQSEQQQLSGTLTALQSNVGWLVYTRVVHSYTSWARTFTSTSQAKSHCRFSLSPTIVTKRTKKTIVKYYPPQKNYCTCKEHTSCERSSFATTVFRKAILTCAMPHEVLVPCNCTEQSFLFLWTFIWLVQKLKKKDFIRKSHWWCKGIKLSEVHGILGLSTAWQFIISSRLDSPLQFLANIWVE